MELRQAFFRQIALLGSPKTIKMAYYRLNLTTEETKFFKVTSETYQTKMTIEFYKKKVFAGESKDWIG